MDTTNNSDDKYPIPLGKLIAEGKTKKIHDIHTDGLVALVSKDDITAGDGKKHDVIPDKGAIANATTCNVFRFLRQCGVPVAFQDANGRDAFIAPHCTMLPYEVIIRREAHGSYLKRNLHFTKGQLFPKLLLEFFLKTSGKEWKGNSLPCDDPLMIRNESQRMTRLYDPAQPIHGQMPFLCVSDSEFFAESSDANHFAEMGKLARQVFLLLEKAWQLEGRTLVDFKVEFGLDKSGKLLLADVIDNDSWRVVENGLYIDKQAYRDGGKLDDVAAKYRRVAAMTSQFHLPRQRIILWRGSESDELGVFGKLLDDLKEVETTIVTCSMHKEPVRGVEILHRMVQEVPDTVVIAYIGRSNGAGPTLSAQSTVPVITVPASAKEFPEDIWSSLRAPSSTPVMTVVEPGNAVLAALQILSARNPRIYAHLRTEIEKRTKNTIEI